MLTERVSSPRAIVLFFVLAFALSWAILLPEAAAERGWLPFRVPQPVLLLSGFGPALAALIVAARQDGRDGVRRLLGRLRRWRVGLGWYAFALLGSAAWFAAALALAALAGSDVDLSQAPAQQMAQAQGVPPLALLPVFFAVLFLTVLGEEIGWRGWALPALLSRQRPLLAGIVLGLAWGLWHVPLMWIPALGAGVARVPFAWFLVDIVGMSILFTWLFLHTKGSLLLANLLHAANNTTAAFLPLLPPAAGDLQPFLINVGLKWLLVAVILLFNRARRRPWLGLAPEDAAVAVRRAA